jgi:hypothetical protein
MSRKLLKPEEIGAELRQVDVYVSRGQSVARSIGAILAYRGQQLLVALRIWRVA